MAKKISLEEYKKLKPEKRNKLLLPLEILMVLFGISLVVIVLLVRNNANLKEDLKEEKSKPEPINGEIVTPQTVYDKNKLQFFDDNVVFIIDGFGDYYYTYDCMMKKVSGNYSYLALNVDEAKNKGYREGSC